MSSEFFTIKTRDDQTVEKILHREQNIELGGLNVKEDSLVFGTPVFLVFGGDRPAWDTGLRGIGVIVQEPYDVGYDRSNFKIKIDVKVLLNNPIKRVDLIPYRDCYGIRAIGPSLKGEPNQALMTMSSDQCISLLQAMIELNPDIIGDIENIFENEIVEGVKNRSFNKLIEVPFILGKNNIEAILDYIKKENSKNALLDKKAENIIYYGVPGSGKSYKVDRICNNTEYVERVVFHPDYTNADFIGQIMPVLKETVENGYRSNRLEYNFIPGPFSNILKKAIEDQEHMYYLVIEEINRGNAASIFGDIFQLLDRDEYGTSKYSINNYYIADYVYNNKSKKIFLPLNLSIYATMNSSDQNVFTLDTAFQRRWIMKNVSNVFEGEQARYVIAGSDIKWGAFATVVNEILQESNIGLLSTEDKGLGAYFVSKPEIENKEQFAEKVFKYLWDDAFKMNRTDLFREEFKTLSGILDVCRNSADSILEKILVQDVYDKMQIRNSEFDV